MLDIHVHIFQRHVPVKLPGFDFDEDRVQSSMDRIALLSSNNADVRQHRGLRLAALNIKHSEALIE